MALHNLGGFGNAGNVCSAAVFVNQFGQVFHVRVEN
ncbi:unknown [Parasutterella excrementihominis CAG:233]|nr:unknown [Parasutterella excrementihominis CAG:233]